MKRWRSVRVSSLAAAALLASLSPGLESPRAESDETDSQIEERNMTERVLFAFEGDESADRWMIVNDGVMGGLSRSRISLTEKNTAVFEGEVSLRNNGGFASVRSRPETMPTAGTSRLAVRVRGDGREYQLRIRTDETFDGVAYRWNFETRAGEWTTIEASYRDFVPTYRGRILRDVPPIDPGAIRQLGFLIADKVEGPFRLEVGWIKALD
jgi:monofunctional biosynthetic peptidoglycan transglycosylase